MENHIEHEGTVASILDNTMVVRIVSSSACGGCAAKSYCIPSENMEKEIHINNFSGNYVSGERVKVVMRQSLGLMALCIGYIVPFALVMATLLTVCQITGNELAGGLSSLLILIPYYIILKMYNRKITKTFEFSVEKINIA